MNVVRKDAQIVNTDEEFPGSFQVILSAPTKDRDGETLRPDEWKQPLPDHITFDIDHGMNVASTVGSGVPHIDDEGRLIVDGTYSSLSRAQEVRTLVNEGHIRTTSVAFMTEPSTTKDGKQVKQRELLNGAFVAVPSNREALVLASKGVKAGARNSRTDAALIQSAHDALVELGANCAPMDDTGAADGSVSGASFDGEVELKAKYTAEQRRQMGKNGEAMPDGSFPIADKEDLAAAIRAVGRASGSHDAVRRHIIARARALGASNQIPDTWDSDGSMKAASFTPLANGTEVSWHYRSAIGHGTIVGVHKMGTTHANTEYSIREHDHHVSESGSHEKPIVFHMGAALTVEHGKSVKGADIDTPGSTAQGLDGVIDAMQSLIDGQDLSMLPEWAAQALSLVAAADDASDELLDEMNVPDPDEDDDGAVQARAFGLLAQYG